MAICHIKGIHVAKSLSNSFIEGLRNRPEAMDCHVCCSKFNISIQSGHLTDDGRDGCVGLMGQKDGLCMKPHGFQIGGKELLSFSQCGFMRFDATRLVILQGSQANDACECMTMPGLPKVPASEQIDVVDGQVVGLF